MPHAYHIRMRPRALPAARAARFPPRLCVWRLLPARLLIEPVGPAGQRPLVSTPLLELVIVVELPGCCPVASRTARTCRPPAASDEKHAKTRRRKSSAPRPYIGYITSQWHTRQPQSLEQLAAISWCRSHAERTTERAVRRGPRTANPPPKRQNRVLRGRI